MNLTDTQIKNMLVMQDQLNSAINPKWLNAGYAWHRAAWIEAAELAESIGWKWWKKQEPDTSNAKLEVVDIWHFALSKVLVNTEGDGPAAVKRIQMILSGQKAADYGLLGLVDRLAAFCTLGSVPVDAVADIADALSLSGDELYATYLGKNLLNRFRQDHGYKTGDYIKDWLGEEDNAYLMRLLAEQPGWEPDRYLAKLDQRYQGVRDAWASKRYEHFPSAPAAPTAQ